MTVRQRKRRHRAALTGALALAGVLALGSCGSSGTGAEGGATPPAGSAEGGTDASAPLHNLLPEKYRNAPLKVAMDPAFGELNSVKPGTTEFQGLNVDLARAVAKQLGVEVQFLPTPFAQIIVGIKNSRYDTSMSAVTDTVERQKEIDFVDYVQTRQVLFVAGGNPKHIGPKETGLCGLSVSVVAGSTDEWLYDKIATACAAAGKPKPAKVILDGVAASYLALSSGRVDAIIRENSSRHQVPQQLEMLDIDYGRVSYFGTIFTKDNRELRDAFLEAFKAIVKSGEYDKILAAHDQSAIALHEVGLNLAKN